MLTLVKQDILTVLDKVIQALRHSDFSKIKLLSDHVIHDASVFQDEDSVTIAVLIYALSKILERRSNIQISSFIKLLDSARMNLVRNDYKRYNKDLSHLSSLISKLDSRYKRYVVEVINQAKLKKSSRIYEHGISLARAASMLGVTEWELMSYVGKSNLNFYPSSDVKRRLNLARKIFEDEK